MRVEVILKNINELECLEGLDEYEVKVERKMSLRLFAAKRKQTRTVDHFFSVGQSVRVGRGV